MLLGFVAAISLVLGSSAAALPIAQADTTVTVRPGMKWTPTIEFEGHCSMGPVGTDSQGRLVGFSAGHCTPTAGEPAGGPVYDYASKAQIGVIDYIGLGAANQNTDYMVIVFDAAKVALSSVTPNGLQINKLPTDPTPNTFTSVRKDGATSGVTTGSVCSSYPDRFTSWMSLSSGDSGAAVTNTKGEALGIAVRIDYNFCPYTSVNFAHVRSLTDQRGATVAGAGFVPANTAT